MKFTRNLIIILLICTSCNEETNIPSGILEPNQMIDVMEDIYIAEGIVSSSDIINKEAERQKAIDYYSIIYKKHNIDSLQYRKSFEYYCQHPALMQDVNEQVINRLQKKQIDIYKQK